MIKDKITVAPVKKYAAPKYPTHIESRLRPELLRKLPARWEKSAAVIAAAGLFGSMTLTSCGLFESGGTSYNPGSENYLNVAPVFIHGEGTGAIGCDMVAPPVFLSEQEALAIIVNAAESAGLKFDAEPPAYTAAKNKPETKYSWDNKYILGDGNIGLDLYDAKKGVAVSFISMQEAEQKFSGFYSTVTSYRPRELAELTAEDFAGQKGDINIGLFYDPGENWAGEAEQRIYDEYNAKTNELWKIYDEKNPQEYENKWNEAVAEYEEAMRTVIAENLRSQVRDFIEWLQGQGIV